jgi:hypothetical protein
MHVTTNSVAGLLGLAVWCGGAGFSGAGTIKGTVRVWRRLSRWTRSSAYSFHAWSCDLHPWMRAWVVVAEHPFYAVTNERESLHSRRCRLAPTRCSSGTRPWGSVKKDVAVSDGVTAVTVEMVR